MALVSGRGSTLNPNAPPFIPAVYRQVEDFSSDWYNLVQNTAWFRDYWMSEQQEASLEGLSDSKDDDITDLLPDTFDVGYDDFPYDEAEFEDMVKSFETYENNGLRTEMKPQHGPGPNAGGMMNNLNLYTPSSSRRGMSAMVEPAKYNERSAQRISPNYGARRIHQPR